PSFCCRRSAQSSTRSRTSGSSCATTGSPTASSNPTTISSTIVVRHGTSSSISLGASCPSDCANGPTGSDQWDLVLVHKQKLGLIDRRQGYFLSLNSQKSDDQDQRHRNDSKSESCHCFTLCFCALAPICAKLAGEMCELLHTSMIDYLDGNDKGGHTGGRRRTPQTQGMVGQAVGRSPYR